MHDHFTPPPLRAIRIGQGPLEASAAPRGRAFSGRSPRCKLEYPGVVLSRKKTVPDRNLVLYFIFTIFNPKRGEELSGTPRLAPPSDLFAGSRAFQGMRGIWALSGDA